MNFYLRIVEMLVRSKIDCPRCGKEKLLAGAVGPYHQQINDLYCRYCGYRVAIIISENKPKDMIRARRDYVKYMESCGTRFELED